MWIFPTVFVSANNEYISSTENFTLISVDDRHFSPSPPPPITLISVDYRHFSPPLHLP